MQILQFKSTDSQQALEVGLVYNMAIYLFESTDDSGLLRKLSAPCSLNSVFLNAVQSFVKGHFLNETYPEQCT